MSQNQILPTAPKGWLIVVGGLVLLSTGVLTFWGLVRVHPKHNLVAWGVYFGFLGIALACFAMGLWMVCYNRYVEIDLSRGQVTTWQRFACFTWHRTYLLDEFQEVVIRQERHSGFGPPWMTYAIELQRGEFRLAVCDLDAHLDSVGLAGRIAASGNLIVDDQCADCKK